MLGPIDDPAIPTLAAVFDPVELGQRLTPFLRAEWGELQELGFQVLKHSPGKRCTLEIGLRTTHGYYELIGKVYPTDRSHVYEVMDRLRQSGFNAKDEFSIPQPVAYLETLHVLLYEKAQGPRAQEFLVAACGRERAAAAERCARWLARFHALAPRTGRVFAHSDHMRRMSNCSRFIVERNDGFGAKAARLLARLQSQPALDNIEMCGVHGDFVPRNVILGEGRTVAYDWDRFSLSDPTRDLASFTVSFQRLALKHFGSITALDSEAEVFEKTYLAAGRPVAAERLRFFKSCMCLQFAKNLLSNRKHNWIEQVDTMLDQGFLLLEEGKMSSVSCGKSSASPDRVGI